MGLPAGRWTRRLLGLGPWLLLPAVGAIIAARWGAWPRLYPAHLGLRGGERLVALSPRGVAIPLAVAAALLAWLEVVRAHVVRHADPSLDGGRPLRVVSSGLRAAQWMLAAMGSAMALPSASPVPALLSWALALTLVPAVLLAADARRAAPPALRHPPPGGWLYVPRGVGVGFAIARGHPAAARAWLLILGPPLAILALSRLLLA